MKKSIFKKIICSVIGSMLIFTIAVGFGSFFGPVTNASGTDYQSQFSLLTDSNDLNNPPVVIGKIYNMDNVTPAAGVNIQLFAWPSVDELANLKDGDPFSRTPVGKTVADEYGNYTLRIDPNVNTNHLRSSFGTLDCEIVASTDSGFISYSFSVDSFEKDMNTDGIDDVAVLDNTNGEIEKAINVDLKLVAKPKTDVFQNAYQPESILAYSEQLVETYAPQWVNVGVIHIGNSGKTAKMRYTAEASSSIGIGFSSSGNFGTYSQSGSLLRKSNAGVGFPQYTVATSRFMDTKFTFAKYVCFPGDGTWYYLVRPTIFQGGTQTSRSTPNIVGSYHIPYAAGSDAWIGSSVATSWSNGAQISGIIGINVSSQSQYESELNVDYHFVTSGRLSGVNNFPNVSPGRVVIQN